MKWSPIASMQLIVDEPFNGPQTAWGPNQGRGLSLDGCSLDNRES